MIEETNLKTYLGISQNKFEIYLFDTKSFRYLYEREIKIENEPTSIDLNILSKFLEENVFNIEKLIGKFLNNICLIINSKEIVEINIGVKKKNYGDKINKNFLDTLIIDVKDLLNKSYHNEKLLHIIISRYIVDGISYPSLKNNSKGNDCCIELKFSFISSKLIKDISKVLEKYHIEVNGYLDRDYVEVFFKDQNMKICEMAYKIENGCNEDEIKLIPKSAKNYGFFEKFFQLFS